MAAETIVFDALNVKRENTFRFDVWYANRYLPQIRARSNSVALRRYLSPIRGDYLTVCESQKEIALEAMTDAAVEQQWVAARERFVADFIGDRRAPGAGEHTLEADILYAVFFRVPEAREREFNAWYDEEHMEMLLACAHWPLCRRYRIRDAGNDGWTHLALHYLTDLRALESPERDRARSTPWRDRLAREAWFKGEYRVYYQWGGRIPPIAEST